MKRKMIVAVMATFLFMSLEVVDVSANSQLLKEDVKGIKIEDIEKEKKSIGKQIEDKEHELGQLLGEIEELEEEKRGVDLLLERNQEEIEKAEKNLVEVEEKVAELEKGIDYRYGILSKRMLSYQQHGDLGYIDVLLGSNSFGEFIDRAGAVSKLLDADNKLLEGIHKDKIEVEVKQKLLQDLEQNLKEIEKVNKEQKENVTNKVEELKNKRKQLKKEIDSLGVTTKELEGLKEKVRESMGMKHKLTTERLEWPTDGGYISSTQGQRWGRLHKGIDIARTDRSTSPPIYAAESGVVTTVKYSNTGYGNMVKVDHGDGVVTLYAHMSSISVKQGQKVDRGSRLGIMGTTGDSTGIHLHFEVYIDGALKNPLSYLGKGK